MLSKKNCAAFEHYQLRSNQWTTLLPDDEDRVEWFLCTSWRARWLEGRVDDVTNILTLFLLLYSASIRDMLRYYILRVLWIYCAIFQSHFPSIHHRTLLFMNTRFRYIFQLTIVVLAYYDGKIITKTLLHMKWIQIVCTLNWSETVENVNTLAAHQI